VLVTAARLRERMLRERIKRAEARGVAAMPAATMMKPLCGLEPRRA